MSSYPGALDTANALYVPINNFRTTLRSAITSTTADIPIVNAVGLQPNNGLVSIDDEVIAYDFIQDQGTSTPVLRNCTRGFDGTSSAAHAEDANVELRWVAKHHNALSAAIRQIQIALGVDPQSSYQSLANRLAATLPSVISFASPVTDWGFIHQRERIVAIQLWRKNTSGNYEQFTAQVEQTIDSPDSTVSVTLDQAEEGYLIYQ